MPSDYLALVTEIGDHRQLLDLVQRVRVTLDQLAAKFEFFGVAHHPASL
jgi:hypothetical protein